MFTKKSKTSYIFIERVIDSQKIDSKKFVNSTP